MCFFICCVKRVSEIYLCYEAGIFPPGEANLYGGLFFMNITSEV